MRTPETVRSEEIRALFEHGTPILWANVGVGAIVTLTLWNDAPHTPLLAWLGAILLMSVVRAAFQARYARERPDATELDAWGRRFVFGSIVAGVLWGVAGVAFFARESTLAQALLTFAIGGMTAAAAGTLSCHLPAFFGYFTLALAPLTLRALAEGDRVHLGMGAMLLMYAVGMQRVARNNHAAFVGAFQLGIENAELLDRLSLSQVSLQETNRTLEHRVLERTRALEQQAEALRQAQRLEIAGRLAGGLAHDFNSLLTVVINNSVLVKESQSLDEHGKLATDETLEAAQRGAALIRQLLAFSRRRPAEPQAFSLNQLVEEWAALFQRILGEGYETVVKLAAHPTQVHADPAQLEQVLVNLVANARAAMPNGGKIAISTEVVTISGDARLADGDYVELSVQHAGASDAQRAFPPLPGLEGEGRQRGAGLAAVWAIVEEWGGRILVDSEPELGTRFRVLLPASTETLAPPSARRLEHSKPRRGARVLVVDDEPTLRSVIRRSLEREGYSVLVAEDGARALALSRSHDSDIDLLITDVMMPGLTGLELARQLLHERPGLRVLFISGFTFEESVPPADLAQGTAYLPKPFDTKVLLAEVGELLDAPPRAASSALRASG
jgi:signal transduction histidine kinase/ActR/RegA family two-component response regulator